MGGEWLKGGGVGRGGSISLILHFPSPPPFQSSSTPTPATNASTILLIGFPVPFPRFLFGGVSSAAGYGVTEQDARTRIPTSNFEKKKENANQGVCISVCANPETNPHTTCDTGHVARHVSHTQQLATRRH